MAINLLQITAKKKGSDGELQIYGDIGPSWSETELTDKTVAASLKKLKDGGAKDLYVHVNSGGGNVFHGMAIYNTIKAWDGKKIAIIDGVAASIASLIVMGCDEVRMSKASLMLIHEPRMPAYGRVKEITHAVTVLAKIRDVMVSVYMGKTGHDKAKIEKLLADETWMTAEEAITDKFASSIIGANDDEEVEARITASASSVFAQYKNIPDHVRAILARAHYTAPVRTTKENKMELTILAALLGLPATATDTDVRNAIASLTTVNASVAPMRIAQSDLAEILMITGKASISEAKGTIHGWKASHEKVGTLQAEAAAREAVAREVEVVAIVDTGVKEGKITPALKDYWLAQGRKDVGTLKAYIEVAPKMAASSVVTPPPVIGTPIALSSSEQEAMFKAAGITDQKQKDEVLAKIRVQNEELAKHRVVLHHNAQ